MFLKNKIIPTILAQTKQEFEQKIKKIKNLGFNFAQIDICDGKFVNNKTFWNLESCLDFELHLMTKNPEKIIEQVKNNKKIKRIIFHIESTNKPLWLIKKIKSHGFSTGLAINPETPIFKIKKYLKYLDLVLIMSVHPGFSGQKFIPETFQKIKELRKINKKLLIEVDGGINKKLMLRIIKSGADILAVGSSIKEL